MGLLWDKTHCVEFQLTLDIIVGSPKYNPKSCPAWFSWREQSVLNAKRHFPRRRSLRTEPAREADCGLRQCGRIAKVSGELVRRQTRMERTAFHDCR